MQAYFHIPYHSISLGNLLVGNNPRRVYDHGKRVLEVLEKVGEHTAVDTDFVAREGGNHNIGQGSLLLRGVAEAESMGDDKSGIENVGGRVGRKDVGSNRRNHGMRDEGIVHLVTVAVVVVVVVVVGIARLSPGAVVDSVIEVVVAIDVVGEGSTVFHRPWSRSICTLHDMDPNFLDGILLQG